MSPDTLHLAVHVQPCAVSYSITNMPERLGTPVVSLPGWQHLPRDLVRLKKRHSDKKLLHVKHGCG